MTISQGARAQLLAKVQSALGSAATGNWSIQKFTTHNLHPVKGTVESGTLRSDRQVSDYRHTTKHWEGDVETELCDSDSEMLIQSAMFNAWNTDDITLGTTPQYLSLEDGALDIGQYSKYIDGLVGKARFRFATADIAKVSYSLVGTTPSQAASTAGGTAVASSVKKPFDSLNGSLFLNKDETGSEIAIITSLDFEIDNGVKPVFAIGQPSAIALEYGRARVSGTMTAFYEDAVLLNYFLNETEAALVLNLADPDGNSWEFRMERVKFNGADRPVQNEQSRIITMPFMALLPTTGAATALKITRN